MIKKSSIEISLCYKIYKKKCNAIFPRKRYSALKRLPNSSWTGCLKKQLGQIPLPKRKSSKLKSVGEAREKFTGSADLKITNERKHIENGNVLVEHLVDENANYDSV